jgi:hypothetical protein
MRYRLVSKLCIFSVSWHAGAVILLPGDVIFAQLAGATSILRHAFCQTRHLSDRLTNDAPYGVISLTNT